MLNWLIQPRDPARRRVWTDLQRRGALTPDLARKLLEGDGGEEPGAPGFAERFTSMIGQTDETRVPLLPQNRVLDPGSISRIREKTPERTFRDAHPFITNAAMSSARTLASWADMPGGEDRPPMVGSVAGLKLPEGGLARAARDRIDASMGDPRSGWETAGRVVGPLATYAVPYMASARLAGRAAAAIKGAGSTPMQKAFLKVMRAEGTGLAGVGQRAARQTISGLPLDVAFGAGLPEEERGSVGMGLMMQQIPGENIPARAARFAGSGLERLGRSGKLGGAVGESIVGLLAGMGLEEGMRGVGKGGRWVRSGEPLIERRPPVEVNTRVSASDAGYGMRPGAVRKHSLTPTQADRLGVSPTDRPGGLSTTASSGLTPDLGRELFSRRVPPMELRGLSDDELVTRANQIWKGRWRDLERLRLRNQLTPDSEAELVKLTDDLRGYQSESRRRGMPAVLEPAGVDAARYASSRITLGPGQTAPVSLLRQRMGEVRTKPALPGGFAPMTEQGLAATHPVMKRLADIEAGLYTRDPAGNFLKSESPINLTAEETAAVDQIVTARMAELKAKDEAAYQAKVAVQAKMAERGKSLPPGVLEEAKAKAEAPVKAELREAAREAAEKEVRRKAATSLGMTKDQLRRIIREESVGLETSHTGSLDLYGKNDLISNAEQVQRVTARATGLDPEMQALQQEGAQLGEAAGLRPTSFGQALPMAPEARDFYTRLPTDLEGSPEVYGPYGRAGYAEHALGVKGGPKRGPYPHNVGGARDMESPLAHARSDIRDLESARVELGDESVDLPVGEGDRATNWLEAQSDLMQYMSGKEKDFPEVFARFAGLLNERPDLAGLHPFDLKELSATDPVAKEMWDIGLKLSKNKWEPEGPLMREEDWVGALTQYFIRTAARQQNQIITMTHPSQTGALGGQTQFPARPPAGLEAAYDPKGKGIAAKALRAGRREGLYPISAKLRNTAIGDELRRGPDRAEMARRLQRQNVGGTPEAHALDPALFDIREAAEQVGQMHRGGDAIHYNREYVPGMDRSWQDRAIGVEAAAARWAQFDPDVPPTRLEADPRQAGLAMSEEQLFETQLRPTKLYSGTPWLDADLWRSIMKPRRKMSTEAIGKLSDEQVSRQIKNLWRTKFQPLNQKRVEAGLSPIELHQFTNVLDQLDRMQEHAQNLGLESPLGVSPTYSRMERSIKFNLPEGRSFKPKEAISLIDKGPPSAYDELGTSREGVDWTEAEWDFKLNTQSGDPEDLTPLKEWLEDLAEVNPKPEDEPRIAEIEKQLLEQEGGKGNRQLEGMLRQREKLASAGKDTKGIDAAIAKAEQQGGGGMDAAALRKKAIGMWQDQNQPTVTREEVLEKFQEMWHGEKWTRRPSKPDPKLVRAKERAEAAESEANTRFTDVSDQAEEAGYAITDFIEARGAEGFELKQHDQYNYETGRYESGWFPVGNTYDLTSYYGPVKNYMQGHWTLGELNRNVRIRSQNPLDNAAWKKLLTDFQPIRRELEKARKAMNKTANAAETARLRVEGKPVQYRSHAVKHTDPRAYLGYSEHGASATGDLPSFKLGHPELFDPQQRLHIIAWHRDQSLGGAYTVKVQTPDGVVEVHGVPARLINEIQSTGNQALTSGGSKSEIPGVQRKIEAIEQKRPDLADKSWREMLATKREKGGKRAPRDPEAAELARLQRKLLDLQEHGLSYRATPFTKDSKKWAGFMYRDALRLAAAEEQPVVSVIHYQNMDKPSGLVGGNVGLGKWFKDFIPSVIRRETKGLPGAQNAALATKGIQVSWQPPSSYNARSYPAGVKRRMLRSIAGLKSRKVLEAARAEWENAVLEWRTGAVDELPETLKRYIDSIPAEKLWPPISSIAVQIRGVLEASMKEAAKNLYWNADDAFHYLLRYENRPGKGWWGEMDREFMNRPAGSGLTLEQLRGRLASALNTAADNLEQAETGSVAHLPHLTPRDLIDTEMFRSEIPRMVDDIIVGRRKRVVGDSYEPPPEFVRDWMKQNPDKAREYENALLRERDSDLQEYRAEESFVRDYPLVDDPELPATYMDAKTRRMLNRQGIRLFSGGDPGEALRGLGHVAGGAAIGAGGGAAVDSENRLRGALIGGAVGAGAGIGVKSAGKTLRSMAEIRKARGGGETRVAEPVRLRGKRTLAPDAPEKVLTGPGVEATAKQGYAESHPDPYDTPAPDGYFKTHPTTKPISHHTAPELRRIVRRAMSRLEDAKTRDEMRPLLQGDVAAATSLLAEMNGSAATRGLVDKAIEMLGQSFEVTGRSLAQIAREIRAADVIDPSDYVNLAKFALDEGGTKRLEERMVRLVEQGKATKEKIGWAESEAEAQKVMNELGLELDPGEALTKRKNLSRAELLAVRDLVRENTEILRKVYKSMAQQLSVTDQQRLTQMAGLIEYQTDRLLARFSEARSEAGRTLNILKTLSHQGTLDPVMWMEKLKRTLGDRPIRDEHIGEIFRLIEEGDRLGLARYVAKQKTNTAWEKSVTLWKAGLLTGLRTHEANTLSNITMRTLESVKDGPAVLADRIMYGMMRGLVGDEAKRTKAWSLAMEKAAWDGAIRGAKKVPDVIKGKALTDFSKWDFSREVNFDNPMLDIGTKSVFRALEAGDAVFFTSAFDRAMVGQAEVMAINSGLKGKAKADFIANLLDNPLDEMVVRSQGAAMVATFKNKGMMAAGLGALKAQIPALEWVLPFTRTPANVATRVFEYTPFGAAMGGYDAIRLFYGAMQGHPNFELQRSAADLFGRAATGTTIGLAVGWMLAQNGLIAGHMPKDATSRAQWDLENRKPNSVLLGGRWRSLERISPLGNMILLGAHMHDVTNDPTMPWATKTADVAMDVTRTLSEQSFLSGAERTIAAISNERGATGAWLRGFARSTVPSVLGDVARGTDPYKRDTRGGPLGGMVRSAAARIPGLSRTLPARLNQFGQPERNEGGLVRAMIDPFYSTPDATRGDPLLQEMKRTGARIADWRQSPVETEDQYRNRVRSLGPGLREAMSEVPFQSSYFDQAFEEAMDLMQDPENRGRSFEDVLKEVQAGMIERAGKSYRSTAGRKYQQEMGLGR